MSLLNNIGNTDFRAEKDFFENAPLGRRGFQEGREFKREKSRIFGPSRCIRRVISKISQRSGNVRRKKLGIFEEIKHSNLEQ